MASESSPCAVLLESERRPTRVPMSSYSSRFAVGTGVWQRDDSTRTANFYCKSIEISWLTVLV